MKPNINKEIICLFYLFLLRVNGYLWEERVVSIQESAEGKSFNLYYPCLMFMASVLMLDAFIFK